MTTESKHTPGPWVVQDETVIWTAVIDPPETSYDIGVPVADLWVSKSFVGPAYNRDEVAANARLIAAAPDMYEALEDLISSLEITWRNGFSAVEDVQKELEFARTAIRKAKGEA